MKTTMKWISTILLFSSLCWGQTPPPQEGGAAQERPGPAAAQPPSAEPKPYEKVITKDAKTKPGVFTVHQVKDKWYYEIPKSELNKEFL